MDKTAFVKKLGLIPHPEGGYFKETFLSDVPYQEQRLYSSILFLLGEGDISHLHILKEDELWYYQDGEDCQIYEIDSPGKLTVTAIGRDSGVFQHLVKKGTIFGSRIHGKTYTLVGCMVSPSFTYEHLHMVGKDELPEMEKEDLMKVLDMVA